MTDPMADPTNEERAETARAALDSNEKYFDGGEATRESIADLVADLLHLAQREGLDPESIIQTARMNFDAEMQEES